MNMKGLPRDAMEHMLKFRETNRELLATILKRMLTNIAQKETDYRGGDGELIGGVAFWKENASFRGCQLVANITYFDGSIQTTQLELNTGIWIAYFPFGGVLIPGSTLTGTVLLNKLFQNMMPDFDDFVMLPSCPRERSEA